MNMPGSSNPKQMDYLYALVQVEADGSEGLMWTKEDAGGKGVTMPLVTSTEEGIMKLVAAGEARALETGNRMRLVRFNRAPDTLDIGDPGD